ncbi:MAG TPA: XRE family transcriptional regulator [archaeon]|nr:XRE family transcriptional regulator [archaeon]
MFKCEVSARTVLPILRRELAVILKDRGLKTGEIAEILETTPAAVSQYISGKRGKLALSDEEFRQLKKLADKKKLAHSDICNLCRTVTKRLEL